MKNFEENIWQPLIHAHENGNQKVFEEKFNIIYRKFSYIIKYRIMNKYRCSLDTAEDCVQDSFTVLLTNIYNNIDLQFKSTNEMFGYLYKIAYNKVIDLIYRVPDGRKNNDNEYNGYILNNLDQSNDNLFSDTNDELNNIDNIGYIPKFIDLPTGNILRDIYDGRKDIDRFLNRETESIKLLELKFIEKLSYKEILTLKEYSNYTEDSLRQKVSRCLKKYKKFIKD